MALGKDFIPYGEVLNLAHEKGIAEIDTEIRQFPNAENNHTAIVKAVVIMQDGTRFSGLGDASPEEEAGQKRKGPATTATLRQSETRAKARAMRDAVNLGRAVDETEQENEDQSPITEAQIGKIIGLVDYLGGPEGLRKFEQHVGKAVPDLTKHEAIVQIQRLQRQANNKDAELVSG